MMVYSDNILNLQQVIVKIKCGGWLFVSEKKAFVRIGVVAATEDEVAARFRATAQDWASAFAESLDSGTPRI